MSTTVKIEVPDAWIREDNVLYLVHQHPVGMPTLAARANQELKEWGYPHRFNASSLLAARERLWVDPAFIMAEVWPKSAVSRDLREGWVRVLRVDLQAVDPDGTGVMTTEELIALCQRGVVQVSEWRDRDSAEAQRQLGEALALLRAGAEWRAPSEPAADENTFWIDITYPGFNAFEEGREDRSAWDCVLFYIPTAKRLDAANGRDWY